MPVRLRLRKRDIYVVMNQDHQANLTREVDQSIESRILKAGNPAARDLRRHKFLMDAEFSDSRKHTRNVRKTRRM